VHRKYRYNHTGVFFTNASIEEHTLDTSTKVSVSDRDRHCRFPIELPVWCENRHGKVAICCLNNAINRSRSNCLKSSGNTGFNSVHDIPNKENFKRGGKSRPNIAIDLDINIVTIDISIDINRGKFRNETSSIGSLFCFKFEAGLDHDSIDLDFNVARGNENTKRLVPEFVSIEGTGQIVTAHHNGVVLNISDDSYIVDVLVKRKMISFDVMILVLVEIREL